MRFRKQHAWGAVLIALFALPVLKPDGIPALESPVSTVFDGAASYIPASVPGGDEGGDSERARKLERELLDVWERHMQFVQRVHEMEALQGVLGDDQLGRRPRALVARVLRAHDPTRRRRSILIDRGADDGVKAGQAVVMGRVYLGRVRKVRATTSLVQLATDPSARLEVFVRTDKDVLLRGYARRSGVRDGEDQLIVRFVRTPRDAGTVPVGSAVFTSNFDERVPAQLLVGTISESTDPDLDRMPTLYVRPALDLDRSVAVVVLLPPDTDGASTR